jgi:hypothetical protein
MHKLGLPPLLVPLRVRGEVNNKMGTTFNDYWETIVKMNGESDTFKSSLDKGNVILSS